MKAIQKKQNTNKRRRKNKQKHFFLNKTNKITN